MWLLVKDNLIENIIAYDGVTPYTPPEGLQLVQFDGAAHIGWLWNDGNPVPVDQS